MDSGDKIIINIAVVEDDIAASKQISGFLERYAAEKEEKFSVTCFYNAQSFLNKFRNNFDIVLMDIELPDINGMEAARSIRKLDKNVIIVFVTNMAQYAVKGYEVEAFDFIVKPVAYESFSISLQRVLARYANSRSKKIWVTQYGDLQCIRTSELKYVEVMKHNVIYHTINGNIKTSDQLKNVVALLENEPFALCNRCYLVNLRFVTAVKQYTVTVGGEELQISRLKRNDFMDKLNVFHAQIGGLE